MTIRYFVYSILVMKILLMSLFSYQYQIVSADEKKGTIRVEGTLEEDVNSYYLPKD